MAGWEIGRLIRKRPSSWPSDGASQPIARSERVSLTASQSVKPPRCQLNITVSISFKLFDVADNLGNLGANIFRSSSVISSARAARSSQYRLRYRQCLSRSVESRRAIVVGGAEILIASLVQSRGLQTTARWATRLAISSGVCPPGGMSTANAKHDCVDALFRPTGY